MARKIWTVWVDSEELYVAQTDSGYISRKPETFVLFLRAGDADKYAKNLAMKYPGHDVLISEISHGYSTKPAPAVKKAWVNEEWVPA